MFFGEALNPSVALKLRVEGVVTLTLLDQTKSKPCFSLGTSENARMYEQSVQAWGPISSRYERYGQGRQTVYIHRQYINKIVYMDVQFETVYTLIFA